MDLITVVRGRLKEDQKQAKVTHDAIVEKLQPIGQPLGSQGHMSFLNPQDPGEFVAIDAWANMEGIQKFMGDPTTAAELGKLFDGAPNVTVLVNSGWKSF